MYISKSGKLLISSTNNLTNITVNGQSVALEGPTNTPELDLYYYLIKCGTVDRVLFANAGSGVHNPILTASGIVFGTPVVRTGIIDFRVLSGSNIPTNPYFFVSPPYGLKDYVDVHPSPSIDGLGNLISVKPHLSNVLGFGYTFDPSGVNPVINMDCGLTSAPPQIVTTVVSGVLTSAIIPDPYFSNCGNGYTSDVVGNISDLTGSGAIIQVIINPPVINNINVLAGGHNYTNPFITLSHSGENANILPIISSYIGNIPVLSSTYFYTPPTISTNNSSIVPVPVMGGIQSNDVVTYSGVTIPRETTVTPAIRAGFNLGEQPSYPNYVQFTAKNRYHQGTAWEIHAGEGQITATDDGTIINWTAPYDTILRRWLIGTNADNKIDNFGTTSPIGVYTLKYIDPCVNSSSGSYLLLYAGAPHNTINLSGPNNGSYSGIDLQSADINYNFDGGLTSLTLTNTVLGSGYTGATAVCSDNIAIQPIVTSGIITSLNIICQGTNIRSTPTITIYGTSVSGNIVTQQINVFYNNPTSWEIDVALLLAQNQGKFLLSKIYVSDPDPYTRLATEIDLNKKFATQDGVIKSFTSANGNVPDIIRFMDVNQAYGGFSNYATPGNLPSPDATNWGFSSGIHYSFYKARFVNTDPANTGYSWLSNKVYGELPWMLEGPDSFGKYLTLSSGDRGYFTGNYFAGNSVVMELIDTAHQFKSAQNISIYSDDPRLSIPITNGLSIQQYNSYNGYIWVTGPSSVIVNVYIGGGTPTDNLQTINSNQIINMTGGLLVYSSVGGAFCAPWEYSPTICTDLGDTACYICIPVPATPPLTRKIANILNDNLGKNNPVYVEYSNEIWNGGFVANGIIAPAAALYGYLGVPWYNFFVGTILLSAYNYNTFIDEWTLLGRDPNLVHTVYGSFWGDHNMTQQILETCQQFGLPISHVAIAPYYDINNADVSNLLPYIKYIGSNGSGWPPGAINDIFRTWMLYSPINVDGWASHHNLMQWWGQPIKALTWNISSTIGGNIPIGTYTTYFTLYDGSGNETTVGNSISNSQGLSNTDQIALVLPPAAIWASGINIYFKVNELDSQPIFYTGIPRTSYSVGQSYTISNWSPSAPYRHPPLVNNASGNIHNYPTLITYEGGTQTIAPQGLNLANYAVHDCIADPSATDLVYDWYVSCQNGGCTDAVYYQAYGPQSTDRLWFMSLGTNQIPGLGTNNKFSVEDARDHNAGTTPNESTMLQGFLNFINKTQQTTLDNNQWSITHERLLQYIRVKR